jgi:hypothetical protein
MPNDAQIEEAGQEIQDREEVLKIQNDLYATLWEHRTEAQNRLLKFTKKIIDQSIIYVDELLAK